MKEDFAIIKYLKGCHAKDEATYFSFIRLFSKYLSAYCVLYTGIYRGKYVVFWKDSTIKGKS